MTPAREALIAWTAAALLLLLTVAGVATITAKLPPLDQARARALGR